MSTKATFLTFCIMALIFSEINCQFYLSQSLSADAISTLTKPTEFTKRIKRDIGDYCVAECSIKMQSNIHSYLPELNDIMSQSKISPSNSYTFTQTEFTTICKKIFSPLDQCLNTCSESESLLLLENAMTPLKYFCNDVFDEYYNSLPCLNSVRI